MTVAILMPTHNRADTIGEAIESCLRQTDPDWHLYIWDDESTDITQAVVQRFTDKRIDAGWWHKRRENEPGVRNDLMGWWSSRGEPLACWLDSDDIMHPDRIKVQREYMESHPDVDLCFSDMVVGPDIYDGRHDEIRSIDPALFGKSFDGYRTLVSPTAMFRPSVRRVPFNENMRYGGCDKLWLFELVQQGFKIGAVRQPLYYLREHPGRLTREREKLAPELLRKDLDEFYRVVGDYQGRESFRGSMGPDTTSLPQHRREFPA